MLPAPSCVPDSHEPKPERSKPLMASRWSVSAGVTVTERVVLAPSLPTRVSGVVSTFETGRCDRIGMRPRDGMAVLVRAQLEGDGAGRAPGGAGAVGERHDGLRVAQDLQVGHQVRRGRGGTGIERLAVAAGHRERDRVRGRGVGPHAHDLERVGGGRDVDAVTTTAATAAAAAARDERARRHGRGHAQPTTHSDHWNPPAGAWPDPLGGCAPYSRAVMPISSIAVEL